ncbi:hypothetical protein Q9S36_34650 [Microbacterium sp. ARD31]|nr:hypothetical protein [Microbacterium sp. ARD31]MDT0185338.1 hypothetical protein [Microbacterium sp. ARD31]
MTTDWLTQLIEDVELARRAAPETELDFILDSDTHGDAPILVLVDG